MTKPRSLVVAVLLAAPALAVLGAVACGPGFLHGIGGGPADAGSEADAALCYDPVPSRPSAGAGAADEVSVLFALESLRLDRTGDDPSGLPPALGIDLDQSCTCSCVGRSDLPCDGDRGRDNALGGLFDSIEAFLPSRDFAAYLASGGFNLLIDVKQWNRERDDPSVLVGLLLSQGLEAKVIGDGGAATAKLDGTDVWTVDPSSIVGGEQLAADGGVTCASTPCISVAPDTAAYVADGKLIARIRQPIALSTPNGRLVLEMEDMTLIADLGFDARGAPRLTGEIAGRIPAERFLPTIAALHDSRNGTSLCNQPDVYPFVKGQICRELDIRSKPEDDRSALPCDALSGAIRFAASPARLGRVFASDDALNDCPPGFADRCD